MHASTFYKNISIKQEMFTACINVLEMAFNQVFQIVSDPSTLLHPGGGIVKVSI
jgi:hypothetical protein